MLVPTASTVTWYSFCSFLGSKKLSDGKSYEARYQGIQFQPKVPNICLLQTHNQANFNVYYKLKRLYILRTCSAIPHKHRLLASLHLLSFDKVNYIQSSFVPNLIIIFCEMKFLTPTYNLGKLLVR